MSFNKRLSMRAGADRRERLVSARTTLRNTLEKPLYEAYCMASVENLDQTLYIPEVLVALRDLLPASDDQGPVGADALVDPAFCSEWPSIWELCTAITGPDGKQRETATLLFFADAGGWKIRLSERNLHLDLWAGANTFTGALNALEEQLAKRPVPWRKQTAIRSKR